MAAGIPYISTDVGIVKYLPGGKIVDSVSEMAFWIDLLTKNRKVAHSLGNEGKYYADENFVEEKIVLKLESILKDKSL